jgi:tetratricopeptide (TPR) repeat protein
VTKAHLLIGLLDLDAGNIEAAGAAMEQETGEYYRLEGRAIVAFARKRVAESDAALRQLIDKYHGNAAIQIAQAYAYRGERDQAFEWLDRAIAQRDAGLVNFMTDPLFASLHGDPRFKTVLRRLNLPA